MTQPAHRPPDHLIDPNLLAPPKPKAKAKQTEVAVVCKLCGTRMHAPLSKVGQTIQCPDCHSPCEVKGPAPPPPAKKPAGPTLDDAHEYGMSDVVQRPKYKPLVVPRGDDAILGELEGADHPPGWSPPEAGAEVPGAPARQAKKDVEKDVEQDVEQESQEADDADPEITLEAPVDRVEIKPELPKTYLEPDPAEDRLIDGRYDNDDLLGGGQVNRHSKDAWKRAPFLYGLAEFLLYPTTLLRLACYAVGAIIIASLFGMAVAYTSAGGVGTVAGMMLFRAATTFAIIYVIPLSACMLAIVQDTANGMDQVESWPDWSVGDWFGPALYLPAAAFVAAFPGMVLASFLMMSEVPALVPPIPVVLCLVAFFPPVLFSMLVEGSMLAPFSSHTLRSFSSAGDGWMLFYVYTLPLGLFGAMGLGVMVTGGLVWGLIGAVLAISIAFLYCRILGRMMWYSQQKEQRRSPA